MFCSCQVSVIYENQTKKLKLILIIFIQPVLIIPTSKIFTFKLCHHTIKLCLKCKSFYQGWVDYITEMLVAPNKIRSKLEEFYLVIR